MKIDKNQLLEKVKQSLSSVRTFLQADGGDIEIVSLDDDLTLNVKLTGACEICPMSESTLKAGVEASIKQFVPEIKQVKAINFA